MEDQKNSVINEMKPMIREMVELSKALDASLENSSSAGELHLNSFVESIKGLLRLQNNLTSLVDRTCGNLGSFGVSVLGYVHYQFRVQVQSLVEAVKVAAQTQDLSSLESKVADFRSQPRALVDLLKTASLVEEEAAKDELLFKDCSDAVTLPGQKHLPKLVLLITENTNDSGKLQMISGIKAFIVLKEMFQGTVSFVKVRRNGNQPIVTSEPAIQEITSKFDLDSLRGFPIFVMIRNGNYYWFRNTNFNSHQISNWMNDIINEMAYITGIIPIHKIPKNIKYFWDDKGHLLEPLNKVSLKSGSPPRNNLIQMGEAPDMWHPMWFVAVSVDKSMLFLDGLLEFHKKFQKPVHPITASEWIYKFVVPLLDWPGWSKITNLETVPIKDLPIDTPLADLRKYLILKDEKNVDLKKTEFYIFFEGEPEEEQQEPEKYDISEFGEIGNITWPEIEGNLKQNQEKTTSKKPMVRQINSKNEQKKNNPTSTTSTISTVQDHIFDYLGEMLKQNLSHDENNDFDDDFDLNDL